MAQLPASGHRTAVTTNLIGGFILEEPLQVSQGLSMTTPFKTAGVRIFYIIQFTLLQIHTLNFSYLQFCGSKETCRLPQFKILYG